MGSKFKCCKTKECANWFCLSCKKFIHPSCWKTGNKVYKIINESLIICSPQCGESVTDDDNVIDDLKKLITELKSEVDQQAKYIKRLKRQSVSFAEDASNSEAQLSDDLARQSQLIEELKSKLSRAGRSPAPDIKSFKTSFTQTRIILAQNAVIQTESNICDSETQTDYPTKNTESQTENLDGESPDNLLLNIEIAERDGQIEKLKNDIRETTAISRNMLTTIDTLTAENSMLANETKTLQDRISQAKSHSSNLDEPKPPDVASKYNVEVNRVCELHFQPNFIEKKTSYSNETTGEVLEASLKFPRLVKGAFPTKMPGCPSYVSEDDIPTTRPLKTPRLVKGAIPTKMPGCPSYVSEDDIPTTRPLKTPRLVKGAIPTKMPGCPSYVSEDDIPTTRPLKTPRLVKGAIPTKMPGCPSYVSEDDIPTPVSKHLQMACRDTLAGSVKISTLYNESTSFLNLVEAFDKLAELDSGWVKGKGKQNICFFFIDESQDNLSPKLSVFLNEELYVNVFFANTKIKIILCSDRSILTFPQKVTDINTLKKVLAELKMSLWDKLNNDLHGKLVKSIEEASDQQTQVLESKINIGVQALKQEITEFRNIIREEAGKCNQIEGRQTLLENKYEDVERALKKNDILVFGLETENIRNLQEYTIDRLNVLLELNLSLDHINNIHTIGRAAGNKPVLIQFISYIKKVEVLKKCKKLKNSGVSISEDLTQNERTT